MTLGQRIAQLRRQHNLSQEELGERLGVSRQAISKWESDAAIPEVDKLVALSRLFGTPVGVLLGVEEETAVSDGKEPSEGENATPSQQEEERIARILEQYSAATHKQLRRVKWNIACGVIIVFALLSFFIFNNLRRLMYLQEQLTDLTEQVTSLQGGAAAGDAGEESEYYEGISDVKLFYPDVTEKSMHLSARVVPKRMEAGSTADLIVEAREFPRSLTEPMIYDQEGYAFLVSDLIIPLDNDLAIYFRLTSPSGDSSTFLIDTIYGSRSALELTGTATFSGTAGLINGAMTYQGTATAEISVPESALEEGIYLLGTSVELYQNGEMVQDIPVELSGYAADTTTLYSFSIPVDTSAEAREEDVFALVLRWRDNTGRNNRYYCILNHAVAEDEDGKLIVFSDERLTGTGMYDPGSNNPTDDYDPLFVQS